MADMSFPWGVTSGLGIVLLGTIAFLVYILTLDHRENQNATKERNQQEDHQQKH